MATKLDHFVIKRRARKQLASKYDKSAFIFLLPWLIGLVGLTVGPMIASLYLSFTNFDLLQPPKWVGLSNYKKMLTSDPNFAESVRVTAIFVFSSVPFRIVFALFIAMLLNRKIKGIGVYRSAYYVPSLIGGSIAVSIMWRNIFGQTGLVNTVLGLVGIHGPDWLGDPNYALYVLSLLSVWQFGSTMVIFLAGLQQIPNSYYDASSIDGASKVQQFFYVTIPMLSPVIFFNLIMAVIEGFMQFTQAFVITGGGPMNSTLLFALYLYQQAFTNFQMGYASAMAWGLLIMIAIITGLLFLTSKFWVHYEDGGDQS
ncbi:sugar ABC transporter permease [Alicyclobacillus fastidiosus]|uniref:Sugar ABC transporter permease n=1 Tax=Alicyclobacillus fastidiosus TaxID=392011 RepID=A0ABY6ZJL1_9BACL|nr:sugar ABC transporter permease [Alicyclobacillus fastidiosus]WAH43118.1 sugar ABC transporter permease [Alicyclobacillus fastidiosus]GMA65120.1 sugar ABC transporter permease [Alicyclobacillus fastidiosus]